MNFETVNKFEEEIAKFFGSPFAIAVDSCTHGVELSLRYNNVKSIIVPKHTYISIPFLSNKNEKGDVMFEKFTEGAIKVIMLAQEEARRMGHNFVGTEQLLLGVIGQRHGIGGRALAQLNITLKKKKLDGFSRLASSLPEKGCHHLMVDWSTPPGRPSTWTNSLNQSSRIIISGNVSINLRNNFRPNYRSVLEWLIPTGSTDKHSTL